MDSFGFWLNRRKPGSLIKINDHAQDVCARPQKFGLTYEDLADAIKLERGDFAFVDGEGRANRVVIRNEEDREVIIRRTCSEGYIRIRYDRRHATLGWQFAGDPLSAFSKLRKFAQKWDIGPMTMVTFTDFGLGLSVTDRYGQFLPSSLDKPSTPIGNLIDTWVRRYEKPAT